MRFKALTAMLFTVSLGSVCEAQWVTHDAHNYRVERIEFVGEHQAFAVYGASSGSTLLLRDGIGSAATGGLRLTTQPSGHVQLDAFTPTTMIIRVVRYNHTTGATDWVNFTADEPGWDDIVTLMWSKGAPHQDADGDGVNNLNDDDDDGDGVVDALDWDIDGDFIKNAEDEDTDTDGDGIPDPSDTDRDGDGVPDDQDFDTDGDGVNDVEQGFNTQAWGSSLIYCNCATGQYGSHQAACSAWCDDDPDDGPLEPDPNVCGENGELCGGCDDDSDGDGIINGHEICTNASTQASICGTSSGCSVNNQWYTDYDGDGLYLNAFWGGCAGCDPSLIDYDIDGDGIQDWVWNGATWDRLDQTLPPLNYEDPWSGPCYESCCAVAAEDRGINTQNYMDERDLQCTNSCEDDNDDDGDGILNINDTDCNPSCADENMNGQCDESEDDSPDGSDCSCAWLEKIHDLLEKDPDPLFDIDQELQHLDGVAHNDIAATLSDVFAGPQGVSSPNFEQFIPQMPTGGSAEAFRVDVPIPGTNGEGFYVSADPSQWGNLDGTGVVAQAAPAVEAFRLILRIGFQLGHVVVFLKAVAKLFHRT